MRLSGIWSRLTKQLANKHNEKRRAATRKKLERLQLEHLEERTLLSVAPTPIIDPYVITPPPGDSPRPPTPTILDSAGLAAASNPTTASDPTNPDRIVAVWTQANSAGNPLILGTVFASVSTNGGTTWSTPFQAISRQNDLSRTGNNFFLFASTPSVTWDRQGNFYVVATQHNQDTISAGELNLSKFRFLPSDPAPVTIVDTQVLSRWLANGTSSEPVYNPVVAIDNNVPEYRDPVTGQIQVNNLAGKSLFVLYNTDTQNPESSIAGLNAPRGGRGIRLMASADLGGTNPLTGDPEISFSNPVWVNDGIANGRTAQGPTTRNVSVPSILFTQGSADGIVDSGRMIIAYATDLDDNNNANTPRAIIVDSSRPAAALSRGGRVADAVHVTNTTDVPIFDPIANGPATLNVIEVEVREEDVAKSFTTVSDLDVRLSIGNFLDGRTGTVTETMANLQHLRAELVAPDGTTVQLWNQAVNAAGAVFNPPFLGLAAGTRMGAIANPGTGTNLPDIDYETIIDQQAAIDLRGLSNNNTPVAGYAPWIGRFRPDNSTGNGNYDFGGLNVFNTFTRADIIGTWTLRIIDVSGTSAAGQPPVIAGGIHSFGLDFTSHLDHYLGTDVDTFARTVPLSSSNAYTAIPSAPTGIRPSINLAQDNTLGSSSLYQGRVYLAYTEFFQNTGDAGDIGLAYHDFAGDSTKGTWRGTPVNILPINDDSNADNLNSTGLRAQFSPEVVVDQETGAVVMAWYDARYDAANARLATMIAVSTDGGVTFSRQDRFGDFQLGLKDLPSFLNPVKTATDAITGNTIAIEPVPSNPTVAGSTGNNGANPAPVQGPNWSLGLTAHNGRATVVWAGNVNGFSIQGDQNAAGRNNGTGGTDIFSHQASYVAGPRIDTGDMGAIDQDYTITYTAVGGVTKTVTYNNQKAPDGRRMLDSFVVKFDRPIEADSFTIADVEVMFRSPTTSASDPATPIAIRAVEPLLTDLQSGFGPRGLRDAKYTDTFRIVFQTPQTAIGTYSYSVGSNIRDRIRKPTIAVTQTNTSITRSVSPNLAIPDNPTPQQAASSPIIVNTGPAGEVVGKVTVNVNITHPSNSDLLLVLVHPDGSRVVLSNLRGGVNTADFSATFDDAALESVSENTTTGSVRPDSPLAALIGKAINGTWRLEILDLGTGDAGRLTRWSLTINGATLVTPAEESLGNAMDQDADGITNEGNNDKFVAPKPTGGVPFEGPYTKDTLPLILPGLHVLSTSIPGQATAAETVALNKDVSAIDVKFDRDVSFTMVNGKKVHSFGPEDVLRIVGPRGVIQQTPTERFTVTAIGASNRDFRITFPRQSVSGQYSVVLGPNIETLGLPGEARTLMDADLNAGLQMLRGDQPGTPTAGESFPARITTPIVINTNSAVVSTLEVGRTFAINDVSISFNLESSNAQNITLTLISPNGTRVLLFDGRNLPRGANFLGTTLSDTATTPIQVGAPPFTGTFNPQRPLGVLQGTGSKGTWRLEIVNRSTTVGDSARLLNWTLNFLRTTPGTGLGDKVADQTTLPFRIFTQAAGNPISKNNWTPVGPIANNEGGNAGQITTVAVDPSDPTGNTVYVAGPFTGIWKTTNFLTSNPAGPTYVPLADFGPTNGLSINSIVVLPRNNDTNRSIIIAATGDGNTQLTAGTNTPGIGFLRSEDGGASWKVLDSLKNFFTEDPDASGSLKVGDYIPLDWRGNAVEPARGRQFDNTLAFKLVADPVPNPVTGEFTVYAAMSGVNNAGGLYRSSDSGKTWVLLRAGNATDVVLPATAQGSMDGTTQQFWAAFAGEGVFFTANRGATFQQTLATQGRPLVRDGDTFSSLVQDPAIPVTPTQSPNGAKGRITLATPAKTGQALLDFYYSSWVYALVTATNDSQDGLYVSKDFGRNFTQITLPVLVDGASGALTVPTNNESLGSVPVGTANRPSPVQFDTGANRIPYDRTVKADEFNSLAVDPKDPRIVYVGGTSLLRVDITTMSDLQSLVAYDGSDFSPAGTPAPTHYGSTGSVTLKPPAPPQLVNNFDRFLNRDTGVFDPDTFSFPFFPSPLDPVNLATPFFNLSRNPLEPFLDISTVRVSNVTGFTNTGTDVVWNYFDSFAGEGFYRIIAGTDATTGLTRLYFATQNGVITQVDQGNGLIQPDIGLQDSQFGTNVFVNAGGKFLANGSRNGNIQALRIDYAGAQPSQLAADISKALFYAATTLRGFPQSSPDVLQTGNLVWGTSQVNPATFDFRNSGLPTFDGGGIEVVADPTGSGFVVKYKYPIRVRDSGGPGGATDFVQLETPRAGQQPPQVTSRTNGLLQGGDDPRTDSGQFLGEYVTDRDSEQASDDDGSQIAINPYNPNTWVLSAPGGTVAGGRVFRTTDKGLNWFPISAPGTAGHPATYGLSVAFGAPDPASQGSSLDNFIYVGTIRNGATPGRVHVTFDGGTWRDISDNLDGSTVRTISPSPTKGSFEVYVVTDRGVYYKDDVRTATSWQVITGNLFQLTTNLYNDATQKDVIIKGDLTTMLADWRFRRLTDPNNPLGPKHPILYVGADGGVFRSLDKGTTWTYFPETKDGSAVAGGFMPHVKVTDLVLVAGDFDPATGRFDASSSLSTLMAATEGRGAFAIRLDTGRGLSGPRVASVLPTTPAAGAINAVRVTFDKAVDPNTFTTQDVRSFTVTNNQGGTNSIGVTSITPVAGSNNTVFELRFAQQTLNGVYTITIGPDILDLAGNRMNQIPDGFNGDASQNRFNGGTNNYIATPTDSFTGRFYRTTTANGPFVPAVVGGLANGTYLASFTNGVNKYVRQSDYASLPKTVSYSQIFHKDVNADGQSDAIGIVRETGEVWVSVSSPGGFSTSIWGRLAPPGNFTTILMADFNGDNQFDLAARQVSTGDWMVGLSNGSGFQLTRFGNWPKNVQFIDVMAADFTGDGRADIYGRVPTSGEVFVQVSNGSQFTNTKFAMMTKATFVDVFAGDFTGDGIADVVQRNKATGAWVLLQATGTTFFARSFGAWAASVNWVTRFGDFDGDNRLDAAGYNPATQQFQVALTNAAGTTFQRQTLWGTMPSNATNLVVGDFNGDGFDDLAQRLANGQLRVQVSDGISFQASIWGSTTLSLQGLQAADVNGDGRSDFTGLNAANGAFVLFTSLGDSFRASNSSVFMAATPRFSDVLTGDFNGDGKEDLAYRSLANGQWFVSVANGNQAYRDREWARVPLLPFGFIATADLDGDNVDDVVLYDVSTRKVYAMISNGETFDFQEWGTAPLLAGNSRYNQFLVGDFEGDGKQDLALVTTENDVYVAQSTGASVTFGNPNPRVRLGVAAADLKVGDFNGDGKDDIFSRVTASNLLFVALSRQLPTDPNDPPRFDFVNTRWGQYALGGNAQYGATQVLDINGDGKDDVVSRNSSTGALQAGVTNAAGTAFQVRDAGNIGNFFWVDVFAADLNGDGRDDLLNRRRDTGLWRVSLSNGATLTNNRDFDLNYLAGVILDNPRLLRRS